LLKLIEDEQWRKQAIIKGLARAQEYTWEKCINRTVEVYKHVLKNT
jgi:alpha-1,3-rhamnosyl/mannosyltransferase